MKPLIVQMTITSAEAHISTIGTPCIKLDLDPHLRHWPVRITSYFLPESRMQKQLERVTDKSIEIDDPDSLKDLEGIEVPVELGLETYGIGYYPHVHYFRLGEGL